MTNTVDYDATAHDIRAVTVYQVNRAEITRRITVQLKAGQNDVVVNHLPTCLDQDSIRVDGIGAATVFDVIYSPPSQPKTNNHGEKLDALNKKKDALSKELGSLQRQLGIVDEYAKTLQAKDVDASTLGGFLDFYFDKTKAVNASIASVNDTIRDVDKEIEAERLAARSDDESRKRAVKVTIVVLADEDGEAELALSYNVTGASWTPLYDVRAHIAGDTSNGKEKDQHNVLLHYRASISQQTGEHWNNVQLTLSTASPQLGSEIPTLKAYTIGEWATFNYHGAAKSMSMRKSKRSAFASSTMEEMSAPLGFGAAPGGALSSVQYDYPPPMLAVRSTLVTESAVSAAFGIEGLSSIPSDSDNSSETHKVSIAEITLSDVELEWISVPKEIASVFLQCKVKNTSEYPLLPGQANIYMGNSFVAKSSITHVAPQESFSASLGVDGAVRITYHPQSKKLKQPTGSVFTSKTSTTLYTQRITIRNARRAPLRRLVVRDQVPASADARIKVAVLEPKEMPTGPTSSSGVYVNETVRGRYAQKNDENPADGDTGDGLMEWVCTTVPAGAAMDLNLVWEVSAPSGLRWGRQA